MTITLKIQDDKIVEGPYVIFKQNVTEEDFWSFVTEDIKCELLDGVLTIHSPASPEHEDIFSYLNALLRFFLDATGAGRVYGSRLIIRLSKKWSPEPDLLVITPNRYGNVKSGRLEGPADLVVEIVSESTRELDLSKKLPEYLKRGVREVWIIDPMFKAVTVHSSTGKTEHPDPAAEDFILSSVLPGFRMRVKWLWDRDKYPTHEVIREIIDI